MDTYEVLGRMMFDFFVFGSTMSGFSEPISVASVLSSLLRKR